MDLPMRDAVPLRRKVSVNLKNSVATDTHIGVARSPEAQASSSGGTVGRGMCAVSQALPWRENRSTPRGSARGRTG